MDWLYYALLLIFLLGGLLLNVLGLPGLWVMVAGYILYAWGTGWIYAGAWSIGILVVLGLLAELAELVAGSAGAAQAGGSRRAMLGAMFGGLVGAIAFTPLIPVPVLGTIAGMCAGAFLGAGIIQWLIGRDWLHSARVGWGAAKGRFVGTLLKLVFGLIMLIVAVWGALPIGAALPAPASPATAPTTAPVAP